MRSAIAAIVFACIAACANPVLRSAGEGSRMTARTFERYIALGDSISIDIYPAADVERRYGGRASTDRVGAVSLLYRNDDRLWPEFKGRDLRTLFPSLQFEQESGFARTGDDLTADGATTRSLLDQVARVSRSDESTLITITAGGNDRLGEIGYRGEGSGSANPVSPIVKRLRDSVMTLLDRRPNSIIVIGTVYAPSDGTNRLPGYGRPLDAEARWLRDYNDAVRSLVSSDERLLLADIHAHFLGHGLSAPERDRWYLQESIIEPNARGASEVRRVWLDALGK